MIVSEPLGIMNSMNNSLRKQPVNCCQLIWMTGVDPPEV